MQIKTRYHCTPIRMAKIEHLKHRMLVSMLSRKTSLSQLVEMKNGTATLEDSLVISYKTKYTPTIWSSNYASWYSPKWMENLSPHKTCTLIFIAVLVTIANTRKQPRCLPVVEWINTLQSIQTTQHYSVPKGNETSSHTKTWRKLNCIALRERCWS